MVCAETRSYLKIKAKFDSSQMAVYPKFNCFFIKVLCDLEINVQIYICYITYATI